jgi:hypothetical protein
MKHKLAAAPLLSLALLILFFHPLEKSDLNNYSTQKPDQPLALSGKTELVKTAALLATKAPVTVSSSASGFDRVLPDTPDYSLNLKRFIDQVSGGRPGTELSGVHVPGILALRVIQQPQNDPTFVSQDWGIATQFENAADYGVTGLLAHNYLSGELFYKLDLGQDINLVYRNGSTRRYQVTEVESYQKLDPSSLSSDLVELRSGKRFTTNQVFRRFYAGGDHVTFQTCLAGEGISNWGLVFIVARPAR